jgi:hypothetical protein
MASIGTMSRPSRHQDRLRQSVHFNIQFNHIARFKSPAQK